MPTDLDSCQHYSSSSAAASSSRVTLALVMCFRCPCVFVRLGAITTPPLRRCSSVVLEDANTTTSDVVSNKNCVEFGCCPQVLKLQVRETVEGDIHAQCVAIGGLEALVCNRAVMLDEPQGAFSAMWACARAGMCAGMQVGVPPLHVTTRVCPRVGTVQSPLNLHANPSSSCSLPLTHQKQRTRARINR